MSNWEGGQIKKTPAGSLGDIPCKVPQKNHEAFLHEPGLYDNFNKFKP